MQAEIQAVQCLKNLKMIAKGRFMNDDTILLYSDNRETANLQQYSIRFQCSATVLDFVWLFLEFEVCTFIRFKTDSTGGEGGRNIGLGHETWSHGKLEKP